MRRIGCDEALPVEGVAADVADRERVGIREDVHRLNQAVLSGLLEAGRADVRPVVAETGTLSGRIGTVVGADGYHPGHVLIRAAPEGEGQRIAALNAVQPYQVETAEDGVDDAAAVEPLTALAERKLVIHAARVLVRAVVAAFRAIQIAGEQIVAAAGIDRL